MRKKYFDQMEQRAVLLSIPRQNKYKVTKVINQRGLPINALPGWESIPLYSKLPMLKCPDNQVIFSKNKIGRSFERKQSDFDSVCLNAKMDYNPLHDPHLRRFYSNEKLLKRLRENGEITQDNDVICTLKQFNEHRIPLHETYLALIHIERNRLHEEKRDRQMIAHAEEIALREKKLAEIRSQDYSSLGRVLERKAELYLRRCQRMQALCLRRQRKMQQIAAMQEMKKIVLRHKKQLNDFKIKNCFYVSLDIQRKRLIALKKHLKFKSDRLQNNIKFFKANAKKQAKEKARQSWETHLKARIIKHNNVKRIKKDYDQMMKEWISNHMATYREKWQKIQMQLENRSRRHWKKNPMRRCLVRKIKLTLVKSEDDDLKNLTSEDIHDALNTAIDLENSTEQKHDLEDCIYKAAKYILEGILTKFNEDLSGDKFLESILSDRISRLFSDLKQYVLRRASQVIAAEGVINDRNDQKRISLLSLRTKKNSLSKFVSFSSLSALIGKGSYALTSDVKTIAERTPTPAGSLTSVVIENEDENGQIRKSRMYQSRDEKIFIEHLFIKFRRQLTVGIGQQVLAAIECHRNNKILDVRKELQEIDKNFLVKIMTRSILSYAVNSCNFHSNALLCQHALAGDIILSLQNSLLKPKRDPRAIVQPRSRCVCAVVPPFSNYCK